MTGFVLNDNDVWARPVGIAFDQDGNLFVSDDANGTIWKVTPRTESLRTAGLLGAR